MIKKCSQPINETAANLGADLSEENMVRGALRSPLQHFGQARKVHCRVITPIAHFFSLSFRHLHAGDRLPLKD